MTTSQRYKTDEIPVRFAGPGAGKAPLTWGQREIWVPIELAGQSSLGMSGSMAVPPGTTVDEVAAVLRFAMGRHQALRTKFERDETGRPVAQVVAADGTTTLDVFDVDDGTDPDEFAVALASEYEQRLVDYGSEWPIQMGVVRHQGEVTHAVVMYNHLVIDGFGLEALNRDLVHLDRATGVQRQPPSGMQPLDQAAYQSSPAGRQQSAAALRHWKDHLRAIPARRSPRSGADPMAQAPRYRAATMRSRAAHLALAAIDARTRVGSSAILLAAYAVSLARVSGVHPSVVRTVVSNRFRPGFADSVSAVNQTGLCVIDVTDTSFDDVVRRAWRSAMAAGMRAYYDPVELHELFASVGRERGEELDMSCFFNDTRRISTSGTGGTESDLDAALGDSVFERVSQDYATERVFMNVTDAPSTLDYMIKGDTWYWSADDLESLVRGVEAILVDAAHQPDLPTGVTSTPAGVAS